MPMDSEKSIKRDKDAQFLMKMNSGDNKLGFQKSLAEVLRQRRELQERIEQERSQLNP